MNFIWNWQKINHSGQNEFIYWAALTSSTSCARYWMNQLFMFKTNCVEIGCFFLMSIFRLYPGLKLSFEDISVRKNLFLGACFCWDSRPSLSERDKKFIFGGTIGYRDSYLVIFFPQLKVFKLHAILHDAAGAVGAHRGKSPGYCYMIGRVPSSSLLRHLTGLLICLYLKLFLPSIFNSVDIWSSISCIVQDIELSDKNFIK